MSQPMSTHVHIPVVGEIARYKGVYQADWLTPWISVIVPGPSKSIVLTFVVLLGFSGCVLGHLVDRMLYINVGFSVVVLILLPVLTIREEKWLPEFPEDFGAGAEGDEAEIEFEGIVSPWGSCKDRFWSRKVKIVRVLRYELRQSHL